MKLSYFAALTVMFFLFGGCVKDSAESFLEACKKAEDAVNKKQYVIADELWEDIAQKYPDSWKVFYNWGTTLIEWDHDGEADAVSRYQKACIQFEKAAAIKSLSDEIFYNWANAYARIAEINPQDEDSYLQACEKYKKATEINSEKDQAFYNWGTALFNWAKLEGPDSQNKYQAACDKFQKATTINPDKYEAFNNWGLTLIYQSKIENEKKNYIY